MDETPGAISDGAPQILTEPAVQSPSFKCPTCSREFGKEQALQTHIIRAHKKFWSTNAKRPRKPKHHRLNLDLTCPVCRNEFNSKATLGAHIRHVHGRSAAEFPGFRKAGPRKFAGSKRGIGMSATAALALPRRVKLGRKPKRLSKECPVCHMTYKTRSIMGSHLRKFHGKSLTDFANEPVIASPNGALQRGPKKPKHKRGATTCPVCQRQFSKAYIYAHVRDQHGTTLTKATRAASTPAPERQPTGETAQVITRAAAGQKQEGREVIFCPVCGTNIHNVQTAVNFGE